MDSLNGQGKLKSSHVASLDDTRLVYSALCPRQNPRRKTNGMLYRARTDYEH